MFRLYKEDQIDHRTADRSIQRRREREVVLHIMHPSVDSAIIPVVCHCMLARTSGVPCIHATWVDALYPEYKASHRHIREVSRCARLQLAELFHPYWKREVYNWTRMVDMQSLDSGTGAEVHKEGSDEDNPSRQALEEERCMSISYQDSKNMHGRMFRLVEQWVEKRVLSGKGCCAGCTAVLVTTVCPQYRTVTSPLQISTLSQIPIGLMRALEGRGRGRV